MYRQLALAFDIAVATGMIHSAMAIGIGHNEDHTLCSKLVIDTQSSVQARMKQAEVVKNS